MLVDEVRTTGGTMIWCILIHVTAVICVTGPSHAVQLKSYNNINTQTCEFLRSGVPFLTIVTPDTSG